MTVLFGLLALIALVVFFVLRRLSVKWRAASSRGQGVRVFDLGADVALPSRSYQLALYLTMKSRAASR